MTRRILFVCLGNICRSPMAEGVLRQKAPHLLVDSAGTSDWHAGDPPYVPMQHAALRKGYNITEQVSRPFHPADFMRFDMILVMDGRNQADVEAMRPPGNLTPVKRFAPFAGRDIGDVPDPYYTGEFDAVVELIEAAADGFLATLPQPQ
ncbi:MAG: low molecular weight protein-tyrosine-phosphatase [Pseudomonadota bacterium]|uniref:protein-tyrosine-phosphatase n=1 Tax=Thalassovita autumnalis TaxID=2072972 RepID=A0A0P1FUC7_9RHOB|nr:MULTISPECIES: low molecular weight protein-tyrosine-phosphatase [Thalassovita]MEC7965448.1 low molecular weight protein-tyrosine-phosphatase [Pseudomonadota bacterium]MEC8292303.1 low molecular weight protein-tyrosine-phosphatase [Pseudomonadota bacterium]CUH63015.1 Low molecular weight protein-tyrosine-phosphatase YfkJ [Thalassovita autumnalis]CUH72114.1 Low molecular weight protein-tyrosine-phosphatase YfkJ [Thalassovita autumnalis]